jgi:hypothetical protein
MPETYEIRNVEIFAAGEWNGDQYTAEDLDDMVEAAHEVGFTPPLKAGHVERPGAPALGWVEHLPRRVYDAIRQRRYDRVSAEIYWDYEQDGRKFPRVLKAVALLGAEIPAVPELQPLHEVVHATGYGQVRSYEIGLREVLMPATVHITLEQMQQICPPCADKMRAHRYTAINLQRNNDGKYAIPGGMPVEAFEGLCAEWAPEEGFRTRCMASGVADAVDDHAAFCNALEAACIERGLLTTQQPAKKHAEPEIVQVDDKWCIQVGEETVGCYDTREEAEAALALAVVAKEASASGDRVLMRLATELGLSEQDVRQRLLSGVDRKADRQQHVAQFAASVLSPVYRPYLAALYDAAAADSQPRLFAFSVGKPESTTLAQIVERLRDLLNKQTEKMFGEVATSKVKRDEQPASVNAREDVARRMREYAMEHKLDVVKDSTAILRAVLDADPELKTAYSRT